KELVIEAGNVIHDEVERISALVRNMLNITEIEMGSLRVDRRRTKLRELLQDAFDTVARSAKRDDLHFKFEVTQGLGAVNVDKDLMRVAINNLLTNAIKYNRPGGQVVLQAEDTDDALILSVIDTGIGISDDDRGRLFHKFYRSGRPEVQAKSGHGLGLALAHEIVTLHQGELRVDSTLDVGSRFTIVLPKTSQLLLKEAG
ncbi:MAG: sensor histidine kinase, partial [Gammaproteobacteria bacterium]